MIYWAESPGAVAAARGMAHRKDSPVSSTHTTAPPKRALLRTKTPGIFRRGTGYVVRFRDMSGKQRQRAARTLAEARRLRSELGADVSRGEYRADTKITFLAYAERWAESYSGRTGRGLRAETLHEYRRDLQLAKEHFGRMRLAEIAPSDVKAYARSLAAKKNKPATVRRKLAPVKALFATAVEDGLLRASPTAGVRIGSPVAHDPSDDGQVKALSVEELGRLVDEIPDDWRRLLVSMLAQTGLRISEGLGLRWQDVDASGRRLLVRQRVRDGEVGAPKSGRGRREVPISPTLAKALAAHRLASTWSDDSAYVFSGEAGGPIQARNLYRWFKPAAERAGVPWAGFHTLRHTAASRWLLSGVTIAQVARLLGHHDPGFTLRTYISVLPADLPAGDKLAAAVGLD